MDDDDKINLELIVALIRHIVRNEDVSPLRLGVFLCTRVSVRVTWPKHEQMVGLSGKAKTCWHEMCANGTA